MGVMFVKGCGVCVHLGVMCVCAVGVVFVCGCDVCVGVMWAWV